MNRPRLVRGLQIAWSVWWGIVCVLLVLLWMRSYWWCDAVSGDVMSEYEFSGRHLNGEIVICVFDVSGGEFLNRIPRRWAIETVSADNFHRSANDFFFAAVGNELRIDLPYWLLAILSACLAVSPWLTRSYSLRTLLIATTLIAVGLGLVVWTSS